MDKYFVIDVETCPIDLTNYADLTEKERLELINPIDSKIVALGIRHKGKNTIFIGEDEKSMLDEFWSEWKTIKRGDTSLPIVGFNINGFDLPFVTARSLIQNVVISPFVLKEVIDLREKINAYHYGSRGKLKEYATLMGLPTLDMDGSHVADLYIKKDFKKLEEYLSSDLELTDALYKRVRDTNILKIAKW